MIKYLADLSQMKGSMADLSKTNAQIAASAKQTSQQITGLAGSIGNLSGVLQNSIGLFASLGLMRLSKEIAETAGRAETLQKVMYIAGKNAGYSRESLDGYEKSLKKLGIATKEARESISKMMQANIDLAKSSALARAAQDLAVVAGWNSSETFQRLIINIQQADTLGLRFMGIIIDQAEAQRQFAKQTGVVGRELTRQERTQATLNAVLVESAKVNGAYEESMTSWFKVMGTTERYVQELKIALGKGLQGTLYDVEIAMQKSMDSITHLDSATLKSMGTFVQLTAVIGTVATGLTLMSAAVGTSRSGLFAIVGLITALSTTKIGGDLIKFFTETLSNVPEHLNKFQKTMSDIGISGKELATYGEALEWGILGAFLMGKKGMLMKILGLIVGAVGAIGSFIPRATDEEAEDKAKELNLSHTLSASEIAALKDEEGKEILKQNKKNLEAQINQIKEAKKNFAGWAGIGEDDILEIGPGSVEGNVDLFELDAYRKLLKKKEEEYKASEKALEKIEEDSARKIKEKQQDDEAKFLLQTYGVNDKFAEIEKMKTEEDQKKALEEYKEYWNDKLKIEGEGMNELLKDEGFIVDTSVITKSIAQKLVALTGEWEEVAKAIDSATKESSIRKLQVINKELGVLETRMAKAPTAKSPGFDPLLEGVYDKKLVERRKIIEQIGKDMTAGSEEYMKGFSTAYVTYLDKIIRKLEDVHGQHIKLLDESNSLREQESQLGQDIVYTNNLPAGSTMQSSMLTDLNKAKSELSGQRRDINDRLESLKNASNNLSQQLESAMQDRLKATEDFYSRYMQKIEQTYKTEEGLTEQGVQKKLAIERDLQQTKLSIYEDTQKKIDELLTSEVKSRDGLLDKIRSVQSEIARSYADVAQKAKAASDAVFAAMQKPTGLKKYTTSDITDKSIDIQQKMKQGDLKGAKESIEEAKQIISKIPASTFGLKSSVEDIAKFAAEIEKAMQQKDIENKKQQLDDLSTSLKQVTTDIDALRAKALEINQTVNATKFDLQLEPAKAVLTDIKTIWDAIQSKTVILTIERVDSGAPGYNTGGVVADFIRAQSGRFLPGYGGGDKIDVKAERGEYIHRKEAVAFYGKPHMDAINNMIAPKIPAMSRGGSVSSSDNRAYSNDRYVLQYRDGGSTPAPPNIKRLMGQISRELERESRRS